MDIRPGDALGILSAGLGKLGSALEHYSDRLYEADRVAQYSSAIAQIDRGFQTYNRGLVDKRWDAPLGADGKLIPRTLGQIDETILGADHERLVRDQQEFINRTVTNTQAKEQALRALEQKAVANYGQVTKLWETFRIHEMVAMSDRNITLYIETGDPADVVTKKEKIRAQLFADVQSGIRYADDAAVYQEKLYDQVETAAAMAGALDAAKAANYDVAVAERWIEANTPYWAAAPNKRQALKNIVRDEIAYQQREELRLAQEHDDKASRTLEDAELANMNNIEGIRAMIRTLPAAQFRIPGNQTYWLDRLERRLRYLENPGDTDAENTWQKKHEAKVLTQLVLAVAEGVTPGQAWDLVQGYMEKNSIRDEEGNITAYPISGATLQKWRFGGICDAEKGDAYQNMTKIIVAYAKDKKLGALETQELVNRFWDFYRDRAATATEEEIRKAADALMRPIKDRNMQKLFDRSGVQGLLGTTTVLTEQEAALREAEEGAFTWRSDASIPYLNELASYWLEVAQREFPTENIIRAEPDVYGFYGGEGAPLFYDENGQLLKYFIEDKQGVLYRRVQHRDGSRAWERVLKPREPAVVTPSPPAATETRERTQTAVSRAMGPMEQKIADLEAEIREMEGRGAPEAELAPKRNRLKTYQAELEKLRAKEEALRAGSTR